MEIVLQVKGILTLLCVLLVKQSVWVSEGQGER